MKTRVLSYLLVAAMLFSMVPFGALSIPASAEAAQQEQTVAKNETYAADHRNAVTLAAATMAQDNGTAPHTCELVDGAVRYTMSYDSAETKWSGYRHTQTVPMLTGQYNSYATGVGVNRVHVMEFDLKVDAMPENTETDWDIGTTDFLFASGFWFILQKTGAQGYAATIVNIAGKGLCLGVLDNATDNQRSLVATGKSVGSTLKMRYEYDVNKRTLRVWETDTYLGEFNVLNATYSSNTSTNGVMFGMRHFADALKETESIDVTMSNMYSAAHSYPPHDVTLTSGAGYTLTGDAKAYEGKDYSFTFALTNGYKKNDNFAVKVNGEAVTSDSDTYTVAAVTEDLTVTVEGVEALYSKNETYQADHRKTHTLAIGTVTMDNGDTPYTCTLENGAIHYTMSYNNGTSGWRGFRHAESVPMMSLGNYNDSYATSVGYNRVHVMEFDLKVDAMPLNTTTDWDLGFTDILFASGFWFLAQTGNCVGYQATIVNIADKGLCLGVLDSATDNERSLIPLGKDLGSTLKMRYEFDRNNLTLRVWETDTFLGEFNVVNTKYSSNTGTSGVMFGVRHFADALTSTESIDITLSNLVSAAHCYPPHNVTLTSGDGYTLTGDSLAYDGKDYTFTLALDEGCSKGANFAVKVNGNEVTSDSDTYTVAAVTEDLVVTVEGVEAIPYADVTLTPGEGYTLTGDANVAQGQPYTFTFALAEGYKKTSGFAVKVNGTPVELTNNAYTVPAVTEDITVTVEGVAKISYVKNQTYAADHRKAVTLAAASLTANNGTAPATYTVTDGAARYNMTYQAGETKWSGYYHIIQGAGSNVMSVGNYNGSYATSVGYSKIHVMEYDLKVDAMPVWTTTSWDIGVTNDWFAAGFFFNLQLGTAGYTAAITNIDGLGLCLGVLDNATDNMRSLVPLGKSVGDTVKMRFEFDLAKQVLRAWETDTFLGEFNVLTVKYSSNTSTGGVMFGMRSFAVLTETESIDVTMSNLVSAAHAYTAAIGDTQYSTLTEAGELAAGDATVKLLATTNEAVVLDGDLYLDINGINYTAASISGNGTIYGMDSTIDASATANTQHTFTANNLSENVTISRYHEIDGKTYWVRKDSNIYMFHNVILSTSEEVALRPDNLVNDLLNPGLSFKYSLQADGRLAAYINAATHGIAISFEDPSNFTTLSEYKAYSSNKTDSVVGGALFEGAGSLFSGIMTELQTVATNIKNAELTIYARAYIRSTHNQLKDGVPVIFGEIIEISLKDAILAADADWENLSEDAKIGLQVLYKAFPEEVTAFGVNEAHFDANAGAGQAPAEGDVVIEFPMIATEIETYSIALRDNIGFTFFIEGVAEDVATAKVYVQVANYKPSVYALKDLTPNAQGLYEIPASVSAAQMTENVTVAVEVNGEIVDSGVVTVKSYVDGWTAAYGAIEANAAAKALLEDMLYYGAAAQVYFDYNTGNLAADQANDSRNETPAVEDAVAKADTLDGIAYTGATMLFQNRTYVRFYFEVTDGAIGDYTFTIGGVEVEPVKKGNEYYIESSYIYAYDLAEQLAVEVTRTDVDGSVTVSYSPLNYIVNMYNKGGNDARTELMQDMFDYHKAAAAYVA